MGVCVFFGGGGCLVHTNRCAWEDTKIYTVEPHEGMIKEKRVLQSESDAGRFFSKVRVNRCHGLAGSRGRGTWGA
jgi:hypothetical protein